MGKKFVLALRCKLCSDADMAVLRELCETRDMPLELERLAKRARVQTDKDLLSKQDLKQMLDTAAETNDTETLAAVGKHLKLRSRRGGSALQEVVEILSSIALSAAVPLALEFLKTHPCHYRVFLDGCFAPRPNLLVISDMFLEGVAVWVAGRIELMNMGIKYFLAGSIRDDDLVSCFMMLLISHREEMTPTYVSVLKQVDVTMLLKICESAMDDAGFDYYKGRVLLKDQILKVLAVEAKDVIFAKVITWPDREFEAIVRTAVIIEFGVERTNELCKRMLLCRPVSLQSLVTIEMLDVLGNAGMMTLLPRASDLAPDVKRKLLSATTPELGDGSDDGF